jgi:hypothetical protein
VPRRQFGEGEYDPVGSALRQPRQPAFLLVVAVGSSSDKPVVLRPRYIFDPDDDLGGPGQAEVVEHKVYKARRPCRLEAGRA